MKKYVSVLLGGALALAPTLVLAATSTTTTSTTVYLMNPLGETDPRVLIGRLIAGLLSIVGSVAVLMIVYAGVLWIAAQGDAKKVQRGKDIMTWTVAGLMIIAGAYVMVNALVNAFTTGNASGA